MIKIRWQTGAISGIAGLAFILSVVLNLSGMSYSTDGDKVCTDCFSQIEVNSTYWNICVEHAGDKTALFRKSTSPVLYINLDKVNEVITTNPEVKTDLLVPTTKANAQFTTEYGYLRNAKDGDCIIKRKTKANPNPSRFYIHGTKESNQKIKWNFDVESATIKDINIDPIWLPSGLNISWLCSNEQITTPSNVFKQVTYEFTCPSGKNVSVDTQNKYASCINRKWIAGNSSWSYGINFSHSYDKAYISNRTIYWNESEFDYNDFVNETICNHAGITIEDKIINFSKCGIDCSRDGSIVQCDLCNGDSNCDGILQLGESGISVDIAETDWKQKLKNWKVDSNRPIYVNGHNIPMKQYLRDCIG